MQRPFLLAFSLALAGLTLAVGAPAKACRCMVPPVQSAREDASAVFEGRVLDSGELDAGESATNGELEVALAVVRSWKGLDHDERVTVFTNGSSAACGYTFAKNASYLVYAREHEGRLTVSSCSRTRPLADAAEDLKLLGAGYTPVAIGPKAKTGDGAAGRDAGSEAGAADASAGRAIDAGRATPARTRAGCALRPVAAGASAWPAALLALALLARRRKTVR